MFLLLKASNYIDACWFCHDDACPGPAIYLRLIARHEQDKSRSEVSVHGPSTMKAQVLYNTVLYCIVHFIFLSLLFSPPPVHFDRFFGPLLSVQNMRSCSTIPALTFCPQTSKQQLRLLGQTTQHYQITFGQSTVLFTSPPRAPHPE
jgi:hypothetical protein